MADTPLPADPEDAGRVVDQSESRVFPCESCGADLEFSIDAQSLKCPFCGHVKELVFETEAAVREQDLHGALQAVADRRAGGANTMEGIKQVSCVDCGAEVRFQGTLTSQDCPYCGTPIQLEGVHDAEERIAVDGVLPFKVEREEARTNLKRWVQSRWFAPNEFKRRGAKGRFSGVYMPYWTYDAMTMNDYHGQRGEHYYTTVRRGDKTVRQRHTRWYPASGSCRRFFDDVLVVAGRGLPDKVVRSLEPWPLQSCLPFTPAVLAGYLARTYDVSLSSGFDEAENRIEVAIRAEVRQRIGGDEQRIHSISVSYGAQTYKHLLLPVWLLAYKFGEKTFQVVVNAATGEVQGQRPYSWVKITLLVLSLVGVGGLIAYFAN